MNEYYIIPDIEALNTDTDPEKLRIHRRRIAANIGDRDALRAILGDASDDFHDFYGTSTLPELSTEDTIESFLEKFGGHSGSDQLIEEDSVPVTPAMDYASQLELETPVADDLPATGDSTMGAIDAFLEKVPTQRMRPKKEVKEEEKPSLSEGFAKILIKNGNYSRALEIITQISLNNPEKSIYFADQIRFLKKLILIQSKK